MTYLKYYFIGLFVLGFVFGCIEQSCAQISREDSVGIQPISDDTRIWTGTAGLRWYNYYVLTFGEVEKKSQTKLDVKFQHLWLMSRNFGLGLKGITQLYITGFFDNLVLGNVGLGPLFRVYPWQNEHWQFYIQGSTMAGYDLALSDALGANQSEGMRYRLGMRGGLTHRLSDKFGVYLEVGPDWEADDGFRFDSRALRLDIGIQLFRF